MTTEQRARMDAVDLAAARQAIAEEICALCATLREEVRGRRADLALQKQLARLTIARARRERLLARVAREPRCSMLGR